VYLVYLCFPYYLGKKDEAQGTESSFSGVVGKQKGCFIGEDIDEEENDILQQAYSKYVFAENEEKCALQPGVQWRLSIVPEREILRQHYLLTFIKHNPLGRYETNT
jgi:hypothetical protein